MGFGFICIFQSHIVTTYMGRPRYVPLRYGLAGGIHSNCGKFTVSLSSVFLVLHFFYHYKVFFLISCLRFSSCSLSIIVASMIQWRAPNVSVSLLYIVITRLLNILKTWVCLPACRSWQQGLRQLYGTGLVLQLFYICCGWGENVQMYPRLLVQSDCSLIGGQDSYMLRPYKTSTKMSHQLSVRYVVTEMSCHVLHHLSCSSSFNLC